MLPGHAPAGWHIRHYQTLDVPASRSASASHRSPTLWRYTHRAGSPGASSDCAILFEDDLNPDKSIMPPALNWNFAPSILVMLFSQAALYGYLIYLARQDGHWGTDVRTRHIVWFALGLILIFIVTHPLVTLIVFNAVMWVCTFHHYMKAP